MRSRWGLFGLLIAVVLLAAGLMVFRIRQMAKATQPTLASEKTQIARDIESSESQAARESVARQRTERSSRETESSSSVGWRSSRGRSDSSSPRGSTASLDRSYRRTISQTDDSIQPASAEKEDRTPVVVIEQDPKGASPDETPNSRDVLAVGYNGIGGYVRRPADDSDTDDNTTGDGSGSGSGGSGDSGGDGSGDGGSGGTSGLTLEPRDPAPKFRHVGIPVGPAMDVEANGSVNFPVRFELTYDPLEAAYKQVIPELLQAFYYDPELQAWTTDGVHVTVHEVSAGVVEVESTHLSLFRLGLPRENAPVLLALDPAAAVKEDAFLLRGRRLNPIASQNVFTLGGSYVDIARAADGSPQKMDLNDSGATFRVLSTTGEEISRVSLGSAPADRSSWVRRNEAQSSSDFVTHTEQGRLGLYSPGSQSNGNAFAYFPGGNPRAPATGDLLINEILLQSADSYLGDANGDGERIALEEEFIELVNTSSEPLKLGGVSINDGQRTVHTFPEGSVLPSGMAYVVFGVEDPQDPPYPSGPFGGVRTLPYESTEERLVNRVPTVPYIGNTPIDTTTLRQTSNPSNFQILLPARPGRFGFSDMSNLLPETAGLEPRFLQTADVDRDLDTDLLFIDKDRNLRVLFNSGDGGFQFQENEVPLPEGAHTWFDFKVVDLTGDGAPELIAGDTDAGGTYIRLVVWLNRGDGVFSIWDEAGTLNSQESIAPAKMVADDWDADGDIDLIVARIGGAPILFRNDGSHHFAHAGIGDVLDQEGLVAPTRLISADMNQDGHPDLVLTAGELGLGSYSALQLLMNNGDGTVSDVTDTMVPFHDQGIDALAVGDVNEDDALDIITGTANGACQLYLNTGNGAFQRAASGNLQADGAKDLALGDLDGDGDADLVVVRSAQHQVWLNDGRARFSYWGNLPEGFGSAGGVVLSDLENDGDLEITAGGDGLALIVNDGNRINHRPVFRFLTERRIMETETITANPTARDSDGDPITMTMSLLPNGQSVFDLGARFTDLGSGNGFFKWTPGLDQGERGGKLYEFLITADDGFAVTELVWRVIVDNLNHPPTLDPIPPQTVFELEPVGIDLNQLAEDIDPDDVLSFSFSSDIPAEGAEINGGIFSWTPNARAGDGPDGQQVYTLTFIVSDLAGASDQQETTVTVIHKNHAPIFQAPPNEIPAIEGEQLEFLLEVIDPDDDPLTIEVLEQPEGAFFDPAQRLFRWTPAFGTSSDTPYPVIFSASDGELTTEYTVNITVRDVNRPPTFVNLNDETIMEGAEFVYEIQTSDPDGDTVTVSVLSDLPSGAQFDPQTDTLTWTPAFQQIGVYTIELEATDGLDAVTAEWQITVTEFNDPPTLEPIEDQEIDEGQPLRLLIDANDPDGEPLNVSVEPLPEGASIEYDAANDDWYLVWVPGADQSGVYPLQATADDGFSTATESFTITVNDILGLQPLFGRVGTDTSGGNPASSPLGSFDQATAVTLGQGHSVGIDFGEISPATVTQLTFFINHEFDAASNLQVSLWTSSDNASYQQVGDSYEVTQYANRLVLSGLSLNSRYVKLSIESQPSTELQNFVQQLLAADGIIRLSAAEEEFLDEQQRKAFQYFLDHVNSIGLVPDRVLVNGDSAVAGDVYTTAAAGFWLAAIPIGVERGWVSQEQGEAYARTTLETYLGQNGNSVAGEFGMYYHFINGDGTPYSEFTGDGVSILDSALLFMGAIVAGEYFGGDIETMATELYNRADWDAFYSDDEQKLYLFWDPLQGFVRTLDYYSEGITAYILAAGSTTHPVEPNELISNPGDPYYAFSQGNFGRILGRYGRDGRPLIQTFFGSLFAYLYPSLFVDFSGIKDDFFIDWGQNTREAVLANYRFAQDRQESGYSRLVWGISASDGPDGYQGLYGAPPLDPGAGGVIHDGTVAPYALAGSLMFAADLALPALENLETLVLDGKSADGIYGLRDGINVQEAFVGDDYLGLDTGAMLLGMENYRTRLLQRMSMQSPIIQRAIEQIGFTKSGTHVLNRTEPRSQHAYLILDTTNSFKRKITVVDADASLDGDFLLELHPDSMDTAIGSRFVDIDVSINGNFIKTVRFVDRRGDGKVDIGSVYVPIAPQLFGSGENTIELQWVDGERWLQLKEITLNDPTGRSGSQETWQIGELDESFAEFGEEFLTDDSYLVGDPTETFEKALNRLSEPNTDILFEAQDDLIGRSLILTSVDMAAFGMNENHQVNVEVSVNDAVIQEVVFNLAVQQHEITIPSEVLEKGWNHIRLKQLNVETGFNYIIWDQVLLLTQTGSGALVVFARDVDSQQIAPRLDFGVAPVGGSVMPSNQYLDVTFQGSASVQAVTIYTDNRNSPIHRFTGPADASAGGLVGEVDSNLAAPLLWSVYDDLLAQPPAYTNTTDWAYVTDTSEDGFDTPAVIDYRSIVMRNGDGTYRLGTRPTPDRPANSPIVVYLVADFTGKPAQAYTTDRLIIEAISQ